MKFSIITVCKDSEKTIKDTILSVITQSWKNVEYIIVDGVSKDKTLDIVGNYQDKITKVISEPDNGLYDAMNKGIKNSSGDYLFFLNSDDRFFNENVLELTAKKAEKNNQELLYGNQAFLNKETNDFSIAKREWNKRLKGGFAGLEGSCSTHSIRQHNKLNKIYLMKNTPCQPATFYRKDVFEKYGYFDTDFKIVSDHEWFLRVFLKYKISSYYLGFPVTVFSLGGISTGHLKEKALNAERNNMFEKYFSSQERKKLEFLSKYLRCFTTLPVTKNLLNQFIKFEL